MTEVDPQRLAPPPWERLKSLTPARIDLNRSGVSLAAQEVLKFQLAHAEARDAVHVPLDTQTLIAEIEALGQTVVYVETAATHRDVYLRRPDLGRKLEAGSAERLDRLRSDEPSISVVIADGLSARAVSTNAAPLLVRLLPKLSQSGLTVAPIVVAEGAAK
jgi:ethanolamine ammonia-lyase small subunit